MTAFDIVQAVIIGLVVLTSAVVAFRKLLPATAKRWQANWSASLNRSGRATWMRALGRRLQPATATGSCGDGCGSCNSCGPSAAKSDVQPLEFRPRKPS
ncbi:hypothetical protein EC912_105112 [Luteibacter rhizovicinus]|uniref:Uncharacterized protein n=1 Tax=Luteibacter rhizovicinus TaxID=242606 RepID=A0A4R3YM29_9GAMM|nr:DUF6587 family protein [Luteibacter rhizovicinus]TCV93252.1 hypothetical protein EC912_105112 [Luteibacter rhizovicinus]